MDKSNSNTTQTHRSEPRLGEKWLVRTPDQPEKTKEVIVYCCRPAETKDQGMSEYKVASTDGTGDNDGVFIGLDTFVHRLDPEPVNEPPQIGNGTWLYNILANEKISDITPSATNFAFIITGHPKPHNGQSLKYFEQQGKRGAYGFNPLNGPKAIPFRGVCIPTDPQKIREIITRLSTRTKTPPPKEIHIGDPWSYKLE